MPTQNRHIVFKSQFSLVFFFAGFGEGEVLLMLLATLSEQSESQGFSGKEMMFMLLLLTILTEQYTSTGSNEGEMMLMLLATSPEWS